VIELAVIGFHVADHSATSLCQTPTIFYIRWHEALFSESQFSP
jgi:hypothetical protein